MVMADNRSSRPHPGTLSQGEGDYLRAGGCPAIDTTQLIGMSQQRRSVAYGEPNPRRGRPPGARVAVY